MKPITLVASLAVVAALAAPAFAQHNHGAMAMSAPATATASVKAAYTDGVVKRVDKASGRVTISHEAIRNLDMPKMTMPFRVTDPTWLDKLKEGDRIRFAAENPNGVLTMVAYEPVK